MANYYAIARSNYFEVKDKAEFEAWCDSRNLSSWTEGRDPASNKFAISPSDCDGGWPSWDMETDTEIDLLQEIAAHLVPGDVAILLEAGAEKLHYILGFATAVNSEGEVQRVSLGDIYDLASQLGDGREITTAEY